MSILGALLKHEKVIWDHLQELDEAEAIGLDEAHKMQVKRYMLERWINEPFFEATLTGCMVRVSAYDKGDAGYVAAEITGVEERPPGRYRWVLNDSRDLPPYYAAWRLQILTVSRPRHPA